jgi:hypothetical protein
MKNTQRRVRLSCVRLWCSVLVQRGCDDSRAPSEFVDFIEACYSWLQKKTRHD